ncbi:MAG: cytochrome-c peroxidase [Fulvivirga sp.]
MRAKYLLILTAILFTATVLNTALKERPTTNHLSAIKDTYISGLDDLVTNTENYSKSFSSISLAQLRSEFLKLRIQYKRQEPLAAYFDPEFVKDYINGAPLNSLERKADDNITVLTPEGFQILDEILFSETPNLEEAASLTALLAANLKKFKRFQGKLLVTDRHVFEASRFQVLRIFTMGLSGFDSPSLSQVMAEQKAGLETITFLMAHYYSFIDSKDAAISKRLKENLANAISYLEENQDFDTFDRVEFFKEHLNPIFEGLLNAQKVLGVETYYETSPLHQKHPVNYFAKNLFDADFLDKNYFVRYPKEEYNSKVIALGRTLFFDPVLSQNNQRACASCHSPEKAFTDGLKKSTAFDFKGTVERNSPTLINAVYADRFFYDLRVEVLDDQIEHVVVDHDEFRSSFLELNEKLAESDEYNELFKDAFPNLGAEPIKKYSISAALSAYITSLSRLNSPFDQYMRGELETIDSDVIKGFNLFYGKASCGTCHFAPVFNGLVPPTFEESESEVLGVPADTSNTTIDKDPGRIAGRIKESSEIFIHAFKTPTVRNIQWTTPYMHNGVYETLEQVVDFYNKGGGKGMGLNVPNQTLPEDPLELTTEEQRHIIVFMKSLSDLDSNPEIPIQLPVFANNKELNNRKIGGEY